MCKCITSFAIFALALLIAPMADARTSLFPDFDGDGQVGFSDFVLFAAAFGSTQEQYDLDGDGVVGFSDFVIFAGRFGKPAPLTVDQLDLPIRALHAAGNWGTNATVVDEWETAGARGELIPQDYVDWLNSLYVNWIGISVALPYTDSMESKVKRVYRDDVELPTYTGELTFSDEALRQMIREFKSHGMNVYLTLAFEVHEENSQRPVERWLIGHPYGYELSERISAENWPWRQDHPGHGRFIEEFWESYTQQAVHFARIAQDEGVGLYSLGTETESLFRTRRGDPADPETRHWTNDFGQELRTMVAQVRAVYSGLLTYDMHSSALLDPEYFGPGSDHLWEDLDLDVVGISAYFPLVDTVPAIPISVEAAQARYEEIFAASMSPLEARNPGRPIMFLEYGAVDVVSTVVEPGLSDFSEYAFADSNGNDIDDGRETQANIFEGLVKAMGENPGVLNGVFYTDNWMASDALWAEWWAGRRSYSIRGKPAEAVIREAYQRWKQAVP